MKKNTILAAVAMLPLTINAAQAQSVVCGDTDKMAKALRKNAKEAPVAGMVANNGELITMWSNREGTSTSVLVMRPDGTSCAVASGSSPVVIMESDYGQYDPEM